MGQYYSPIALEISEFKEVTILGWLYTHDYKNGLKLMEHSWIGNNFMNIVETLLSPSGEWYKKAIVWAGDYAEKEEGTDSNLYSLAKDNIKLKPADVKFKAKIPADKRYVLNHTKKMYVDKKKVPISDKEYKLYIHPLSLLTCEGNGQGGGDFWGKDPNNIVGSWARNIISVEGEIPQGYTELEFNLVKGR